MNDPEVERQISNIEQDHESGEGLEQEWDDEQTLLKPARWWFASTASPLLAGTFGPIASAFNICAIVQYWREYVPNGGMEGTGTQVKDPAWLVGVNGVSLLFAVVANAALMLNMVGRVKFAIAQPLTIVGFFTASIILIALVGIASTSTFALSDLPPDTYMALTGPYYFAAFAAGLYFLMAMLMTLTVWGALTGKYERKFALTGSQTTLMMQTISLMVYLLVGAAIYSALEGWRYSDAVYYADFTLLTIGIGDEFVPTTLAARALVIPYTFGGILAVGLVISSIRSLLLDKGARKLHARAVEKKRARVDTIEEAEWGYGTPFAFLNPKIKRNRREPLKFGSERERRKAEFQAMRRIQSRTAEENKYRALAVSTSMALVLWLVGALVFYETERDLQGFTYFETVYFAWISLLTIGYGDLEPVSNAGKTFFVFWSLLAIPTLTVLISDMSDTVVKGVSDATNWIGSLTVLPGDDGLFDRLRKNANRFSGGLLYKRYGPAVREAEEEHQRRLMKGRTGTMPRILHERMQEEERQALDEWVEEEQEGRPAGKKDVYFYHFLLIRELRSLLADTQLPTPKRYTYDEWAYYLKLLGHEENDASFHATKHNRPRLDDEEAPQVGRIVDHKGRPRDWSWLSLQSPLSGAGLSTEANWLSERFLSKLESELHFRGKRGHGQGRGVPPPFSITAIRSGKDMDAVHREQGFSEKELKMRESGIY